MKPLYEKWLAQVINGVFYAGFIFGVGTVLGAGATSGVALMLSWFGK